MFVEQAIFQLLREDARVSGIVGAHVFPGAMPQSAAFPAVVYRVLAREGVERLEPRGSSGLVRTRIRTFSTTHGNGTYAAAKELSDAVRLCLSGFVGTLVDGTAPDSSITIQGIATLSTFDLYESQTQTHQVLLDFDVWATETQPQ